MLVVERRVVERRDSAQEGLGFPSFLLDKPSTGGAKVKQVRGQECKIQGPCTCQS